MGVALHPWVGTACQEGWHSWLSKGSTPSCSCFCRAGTWCCIASWKKTVGEADLVWERLRKKKKNEVEAHIPSKLLCPLHSPYNSLFILRQSPGYLSGCELQPSSHTLLQAWLCTLHSPGMRSCLFSKVQGSFRCPMYNEIQLFFGTGGPSSWMTHTALNKDNRINEEQDLLLLEATRNRFRAGLLEWCPV